MYSVEKKALLYSLIQLWSWKTNMSINYRHYIWGRGADFIHTDYIYILQTQTYKRTAFTTVELE